MDNAIALTQKVYAEDEGAIHHNDFYWLVDAVVKVTAETVPVLVLITCLHLQGNHKRIGHLVQSCGLNINSRNKEAGNRLKSTRTQTYFDTILNHE